MGPRALPSDAPAALETDGVLSEEELTSFKDDPLIAAQRDGDMRGGILPAGQLAGAINDLIHVVEFVAGMVDEAIRVIGNLGSFTIPSE